MHKNEKKLLIIKFLIFAIARKPKYYGTFGKKVGGGPPARSKPVKKGPSK